MALSGYAHVEIANSILGRAKFCLEHSDAALRRSQARRQGTDLLALEAGAGFERGGARLQTDDLDYCCVQVGRSGAS